MINKTGEEEWDNRVNNIYSSIGELITEFEFLLHTICQLILAEFKKNGLKDEFLARILLSDSTGINVKNYFLAILKHKNRDKETHKTLNKYYKTIDEKISEAIAARNKITHSAWGFAGAVEKEDEDYLISFRDSIKSKGLVHFLKEMRKSDFDYISKNIYSLNELIEQVPITINSNDERTIIDQTELLKKIKINFNETKYTNE